MRITRKGISMKQHTVERTIQWGDLDSLGIVFYPRYYEWMDAGSHAFFDAIGLNLYRLWQERHLAFGLVETACRYLAPGRYQQTLQIVTTLEEVSHKTVQLNHAFRCRATHRPMLEGIEKRICMKTGDSGDLKAVAIPRDILSVLTDAS